MAPGGGATRPSPGWTTRLIAGRFGLAMGSVTDRSATAAHRKPLSGSTGLVAPKAPGAGSALIRVVNCSTRSTKDAVPRDDRASHAPPPPGPGRPRKGAPPPDPGHESEAPPGACQCPCGRFARPPRGLRADNLRTSRTSAQGADRGEPRPERGGQRVSSRTAIVVAPTLVGTVYAMNLDDMPKLRVGVRLPVRPGADVPLERDPVARLPGARLALRGPLAPHAGAHLGPRFTCMAPEASRSVIEVPACSTLDGVCSAVRNAVSWSMIA